MSTFVFENMTQAQANAVTNGDIIAFATATTTGSNIGITVSAATDTINMAMLTTPNRTLAFDTVVLQQLINNDHLVFNDGSRITVPLAPSYDRIFAQGGNDDLNGRGGNDEISGGAGNDTISGGTGQDRLTGEQGADLFSFAAGDARFVVNGGTYTTDTILDFQDGIDKIRLNSDIGTRSVDVSQGASGAVFTTVATASIYAQQLLDANTNGGDVAVIKVGADSYIFYNDTAVQGAEINSIIKLTGISASQITSDDFVTQSGLPASPPPPPPPPPVSPPPPPVSPPPPPVSPPPPPVSPPPNPFMGTAGNDNITGNALGNEIIGLAGHDNLFGAGGNDRIDGGDGNDHLYGFDITGDPTTDGDDTITGGAGSDYIQGNAGDDVLYGEDGSDRVNGGQGDDTILGGDGNDSINGNKGEDYISAGTGNDTVRGGQGDDEMNGDEGNDVLFGDLGNDRIFGGAGIDMATGGQGADSFAFFQGHARNSGDDNATYDSILDFEDGIDRIVLNSGIGTAAGDVIQGTASFATVSAAKAHAQQLLDGHAGTSDVAVVQVGTDAYLFYNDADGAAINSVIKLAGISAGQITNADFSL